LGILRLLARIKILIGSFAFTILAMPAGNLGGATWDWAAGGSAAAMGGLVMHGPAPTITGHRPTLNLGFTFQACCKK